MQVRRQLLAFLAWHTSTWSQVAPDVELVKSAREGLPSQVVGGGGGGERASGEAGGAFFGVVVEVEMRLSKGDEEGKKEKNRWCIRSFRFLCFAHRLLFLFLSAFSLSLSLSPLFTHRVRICFSIEYLAASPAP